jgi:hypothetical protein
MKPTWKSSKGNAFQKIRLTVLGYEPLYGATEIDFLDARRRADAEGKGNETLLGGNGIQNRGGGENVVGLRQDGDGFRGG